MGAVAKSIFILFLMAFIIGVAKCASTNIVESCTVYDMTIIKAWEACKAETMCSATVEEMAAYQAAKQWCPNE